MKMLPSRAAEILWVGSRSALPGSTSSSSLPLWASLQQRPGSGRSRSGSGLMQRVSSTALEMNDFSEASSILLVEKEPKLPPANMARLSEESQQRVTLSTSEFRVATRFSSLRLSVTLTLSAPASRAISRQLCAVFNSLSLSIFSSYSKIVYQHRRHTA